MDLNKSRSPKYGRKKSKQTKNCHVQGMTFLSMMITFLPSLDNAASGCQERLLRSRNFCIHVNVVSHLYSLFHET